MPTEKIEEQLSLGDMLFEEKSKLEGDILKLLSEFTQRTGVGVFAIRYSRSSDAGFLFRPNEHTFNLSIKLGVE